ncbi:hypothetical protein CRYUN_Cryun23aG0104100 [Craigia yunnanensis]
MENSCPLVELSGQDSLSLEASDSNALILPTKRSKKRKGKDQELVRAKEKQTPKLSKTQIRKLKKEMTSIMLVQEEKEKALLLSKSIETLEKYKIPEDTYSLLQSSKTIGQAETMREKRRRAIQFSKAGLEVPHSDKSSKARDERQVAKHARDSLASSQEPVFGKDLGLSCSSIDTLPTMEVSLKNHGAPLEEGTKTCIPNLPVDNGRKSSILMGPLSAPIIVHVSRPDEIENKRNDLPIVMMEQEIMEAINENSTVMICGETGCGKTTQVPQVCFFMKPALVQTSLLFEVVSLVLLNPVVLLSLLLPSELLLNLVFILVKVGFQVRHDKKIGDRCSIKFMTDGILLREVQNDILQKCYSVIILDKAHERSLNTDILIGMLSRVIRLRQDLFEKQQRMVLSGQSKNPENMILPLKLILMSATLRVEDFISGRRLFHVPPPVIEVPTRQYPVTVHFSKRTELVDYIGQAFKKVMSIHKRLPQGGILVFVTGQREVEYLCRRLCNASREVTTSIFKWDKSNEATAPSDINSVEDINMTDISEAFEINGDSTHQQTDRFSSYDENQYDYASYDSETESELEIFGEDGNKLDHKSMENGDNLVDVLGGDIGSLASLGKTD